jgi:regulator of cell morphogenesis and NO signaling
MNTILCLLQNEHERLDKLFFRFQELMEDDREAANSAFREFDLGLRRHIQFEEEALFPLYEKEVGVKGAGPTDVMRLEHHIIQQVLSQLGSKLRVGSSQADAEQIVLIRLFRGHADREVAGIYSTLSGMVSPYRDAFPIDE